MHTVLWVVSVILLVCFGSISWFNGKVCYDGFVRHRHTPSWMPLIAGIFGAAGLLLLPVAGAKRWCWVPFLLDYGSVPGLLHTAWFWLVQYPKYKREHPDDETRG